MISIIIPHYGSFEKLKKCLISLERIKEDLCEIIIIANSSFSQKEKVELNNYQKVIVLEPGENLGFAKAINLGAEKAKGQYLLFLNNDILVEKDNSLKNMKAILDSDPSIKIVGGFQKRNNKLYGGGYFTLIGGAGVETKYPKWQKIKEIGFVGGGAMMIEKNWFFYLGKFDENYFIYIEDVDLCLRNWLSGKKTVLCLDSQFIHQAGSEKIKFEKFADEICKNQLITLIKNFDLFLIPFGIAFHILYYLFIIIKYFLKEKKISIVRKILKGYWWVIKNLAIIIQKRKRINQIKKISTWQLIKKGLFLSYLEIFKKLLKWWRI